MRIALVSLLAFNCFAQEIAVWPENIDDNDYYFNTKFLSNYSAVSKKLIEEENFKDITFISADGIQLAGLVRLPKDAIFSIICCAGFLPGRKEGLATFVRLFPKNANILFFDARGHGSSTGKFWTNLHNYGLNEYQDIAAAVDYIKKNSAYNTPIFLHGLCAGAYHAANTLITIPKDNQIKGLIFDSGFTNPLTSMDIPGHYCKEKIAPGICASIYKENKEKAKTRFLAKVLGALASGFFRVLGACVHPFLKLKAAQLDLLTKMQAQPLDYPVLFIHAESDKFAKIDSVKQLSQSVSDRDEWWIPDAKNPEDPRPEHALNQIKCKHEYLKKLQAFINKQLNITQNN